MKIYRFDGAVNKDISSASGELGEKIRKMFFYSYKLHHHMDFKISEYPLYSFNKLIVFSKGYEEGWVKEILISDELKIMVYIYPTGRREFDKAMKEFDYEGYYWTI